MSSAHPSPGNRVFVSYGKSSERPVSVGRLQGTVRRLARVDAVHGGNAVVRLWDPTLQRYGDPLRVGLACIEAAS